MKRAFDVAVSSAGLVMTLPIMIAAAIAIKLDSRGPVLYRGVRVGRNGRPFQILKLRTMQIDADRVGPAITTGRDPRLTSAGRLLRRLKIDELPQLMNVLKGEMSLVGPRPEHPDYVAQYSQVQRRVLDVRPGLTGPSTVAYVDEESLLEGADPERDYLTRVMPDKLSIDLRYMEGRTFSSDLWILMRTVAAVAGRAINRRVASRRGSAG